MKVQSLRKRIEKAGAQVVFVGFDPPERLARGLLHDIDFVFPFAYDVERAAYRAWGLRRIPWWRLFLDPAVWKAYARLMLREGERIRTRGLDIYQLGGDFIVDGEGRIAWARPQVRDDRPPVGELVRRL